MMAGFPRLLLISWSENRKCYLTISKKEKIKRRKRKSETEREKAKKRRAKLIY